VTSQRSTFLAHATILKDFKDLGAFFEHLSDIDPRLSKDIRKATHRMYAWKTKKGDLKGQNDGGESGAGNLLARIVGSHKAHDGMYFCC
jgi:putative IMPACT (imprinted ancient) family translation regulator